MNTGPEILAAAGLLQSHEAALHHEAIPAFRERHLGLGLSYGLYTIDGRRATCAGGVATLDFSLALIARLLGDSLAQQTAEALIYARRPAESDSFAATAGESWMDLRLTRAVRHLSSLQSPAGGSVHAAAQACGLSERQLQRLFEREFGYSPREFIRRHRLRRAQHMLAETGLPIGTIALTVGYASGNEFGRTLQKAHGESPSRWRKCHRSPG